MQTKAANRNAAAECVAATGHGLLSSLLQPGKAGTAASAHKSRHIKATAYLAAAAVLATSSHAVQAANNPSGSTTNVSAVAVAGLPNVVLSSASGTSLSVSTQSTAQLEAPYAPQAFGNVTALHGTEPHLPGGVRPLGFSAEARDQFVSSGVIGAAAVSAHVQPSANPDPQQAKSTTNGTAQKVADLVGSQPCTERERSEIEKHLGNLLFGLLGLVIALAGVALGAFLF
jgi:hypothetical protein